MGTGVLIFFNDHSLNGKDRVGNIEAIIKQLPNGLERPVILMASMVCAELDGLGLPVIIGSLKSGLLGGVLRALKKQPSRRLLVLDGDDFALSSEQLGSFLDHSNRLPQMTVVARSVGQQKDFPLLLSSRSVRDIEDFIGEGGGSVREWLSQTVYMEGKL